MLMTFNQSALDFKKMITTIATWDLTIFIMQSQGSIGYYR